MNSLLFNRLKHESKEMDSYPQFTLTKDSSNELIWYVSFKGVENTLYENEEFTLKFEFSYKYVIIINNNYIIYYIQPTQKPSVTFVGNIPINPFIFSNGIICLDILDTDWTPILKVSSVTLSILSMLSSTKEKRKPYNDAEVCKSGLKNFNQGIWRHHYKNIQTYLNLQQVFIMISDLYLFLFINFFFYFYLLIQLL